MNFANSVGCLDLVAQGQCEKGALMGWGREACAQRDEVGGCEVIPNLNQDR